MKDCLLAIELSSRHTEVGVGRGSTFIDREPVGRATRHADDLMPAIDRLLHRHSLGPDALGAVAVSIGPGGFTGLRLAVTTAKMLEFTLGVRIVAVPTAVALAELTTADHVRRLHQHEGNSKDSGAGSGPEATSPPRSGRLLVALAGKRDTVWLTTFELSSEDPETTAAADAAGVDAPAPTWLPVDEGRLATPDQLPGTPELQPDLVVVDQAPDWLEAWAQQARIPLQTAAFDVRGCWQVGRRMCLNGRFTTAVDLTPLYARPPEAVRLWNKRPTDAGARDATSSTAKPAERPAGAGSSRS